MIFYEAPHRIAATLKDAREILGEREAVVARELSKLHEEFVRGRLSELSERFAAVERARVAGRHSGHFLPPERPSYTFAGQ